MSYVLFCNVDVCFNVVNSRSVAGFVCAVAGPVTESVTTVAIKSAHTAALLWLSTYFDVFVAGGVKNSFLLREAFSFSIVSRAVSDMVRLKTGVNFFFVRFLLRFSTFGGIESWLMKLSM